MSHSRYVVGVDLGTTNSALAYVDLESLEEVSSGAVRDFAVPQLVAPGETADRRLLPSCAYLPAGNELSGDALTLPWGARPLVVGELAKVQGARVPGRLVASAKSWLCNAAVDRTAPVLPWGAPEGVKRISPVAASTLYLRHLCDAWDHAHPHAPLSQQEVILTVPASFDEVARELTVRAARDAGLQNLALLEEPQAAFYWWSAHHRAQLRDALGGGQKLVLVVDVGGGTSDFTLIHVGAEGDTPTLRRIAVGDHILLGGDNVDVTLARLLEPRLSARIDAAQLTMLIAACRSAKEQLLVGGGPDKVTVAIAGRGSRLVGSTLTAELTAQEVLGVVRDGFFPNTRADERPQRHKRTGLAEFGLPYASDAAVTRHLAAFLAAHAEDVAEVLGGDVTAQPRPDAILLNGGVFTPRVLGEHLAAVVSSWYGGAPVPLLSTDALDLGVARGAAWMGLVKRGKATRIGGGAARAYFLGVDGEGGSRGDRALCVIPRHLEEEVPVELPRTFALVVGRPVHFPLYASSRARTATPGDVVALEEGVFEALPPIQTVLRTDGAAGAELPVRLHAKLSTLGTLELYLAQTTGDARWQLEFQVRGGVEGEGEPATAPVPKRLGEAAAAIDAALASDDVRPVKALPKDLERILGSRDGWSTALCRELWQPLFDARAGRKRSAEHERVFCNLLGYCLRPGFGAPLDAWRATETFNLYCEGVVFLHEPANWSTWYILWRRVAGGLDAAAQKRILDSVLGKLKPDPAAKDLKKTRREVVDGWDELVRMVASLERVSVPNKVQAGLWLQERVGMEGPAAHLLWAVGRLGARVPFYGSVSSAVPPPQAAAWARKLASLDKARPEELVVPLAQLSRMTGDRARDIEPAVREKVVAKLRELKAPPAFVLMVSEVVELEAAIQQRVFGESLPPGLRLLAGDDGTD